MEIREEEKKEEIKNLFRSHKQLTTQIGDKKPSNKEDTSLKVLETMLNQWSVSADRDIYKSLKSKKGSNRKTNKNSKQKTTI